MSKPGPGGHVPIERIDDCRWRIPMSARADMRVEGIVYADDALMEHIRNDPCLTQVANVATLPGIVRASLAMPDIHWGYGFCIGGVAATDPEQGGVISPGGVGYDINCGVRLIRSDLTESEVRPRLETLVNDLFARVPCGVGGHGRYKFDRHELKKLLSRGSSFVLGLDLGTAEDHAATEAGGVLPDADADAVSDRAYERGKDQCGTLGSGNHFLEVQVVDEVFYPEAATVLGLAKGTVTVMIHSGSRGLGYQVCEDFLKVLRDAPKRYGIELPDRQLVCAPVHSNEGQRYLAAMRAAANFAWCNRQIMTHLTRQSFAHVFGKPADQLGMKLVYDVCHNIAKFEPYEIDGRTVNLCVHRKGATRAFPPGHPEIPEPYRAIGQPVLIPGDMGRASYVLVGQAGAMAETFGSTCHGAGRMMSRTAAIKSARGRSIQKELAARGVIARARGRTGLDEEQPDAYKDVNDVTRVVEQAGISRRVCRLRPIGVIKG
ncbi:MAG: RtcB family protein [Phycisphaerae bacterium]|nr:RtcB family protein [Phycisphaerae bacterium]